MKKKRMNDHPDIIRLVKKGVLIMKLTLFLIILCVLQSAASVYSQTKYFSMSEKEISIKELMQKIESKSEFRFFYEAQKINVNAKVEVDISNGTIDEILKQVFDNHEIEYKVLENNFIVLKLKNENGNFAIEQQIQQKQRSISGKVTDATGISLPGVTVMIKETTIGTITDSNGIFSIPNVPSNATLVFSFVGMKTQEIVVGNNSTINVELAEETIGIEEVVAIGYGTKLKGELTGAVSKVDNKLFETRPITNTMNALQGGLPGVTVTRGSGQPGNNNYSLQIRGASSISGSKPLILIDGIPGDLDLLNPNDISELTVLKDAAAAIYGARAADGVILVTTKKGKRGTPTITYSGNYGIKKPTFLKTKTNTQQLAEMFDEGMRNVGEPGVSQEVFNKIKANAEPDVESGWLKYLENYPGFYQSHNWNDVVYGNGVQQMHNVSISGGGDNNNYLISTGYQRNGGTFNFGENHSDRYNLRMNYDFKFFDRLNVETRSSFESQQTIEPSALDLVMYILPRIGSYVPLYNTEGQFYKYQGGFRNPAQYLQEAGSNKSDYSILSTNVKFNLSILNDLKLVTQLGARLSYRDNKATHPTFTEYNWDGSIFDKINVPNSADYYDSKNLYKISTAYLDYNKILNNKHHLNLMAGASHETNDSQSKSITGYNFASNELFTLNLADRTKTEYADFTGYASDWALQSYFGRFSYSYDEKYLVDITTRIDGSSKFAPSKRWSALFPSVAFAWNLSKEDFFKSLNTFDNLKLRASWGQSGNQDLAFGNYDYISLISLTGKYPMGFPNVGLPGAVPNIASQERTWETIETKNVGIDFTVLKSRLSGSFDYYVKTNNNMLVNAQLPAVLGGDAPTQNIGKLKTNGWDLLLGWNDKKGDFKYSISVIVSDSKNKLVELKGNDAYSEGLVYARQGYSLNSYFGYEFDGIIQNEGQLAAYKQLENVPTKLGLGDVMFKDLDGDGKITAYGDPAKGTKGDMKYLGNLLPRYTYSSNISLSYKRFDLNILLQGVGKRQGMVEGTSSSRPFFDIWDQPMKYFYGKTWSPDNLNSKYPRIIPGSLGWDELRDWDWSTSSMRMNNYAYLKLKTLTLAYNIPKILCSKLKMESIRVYFSGEDLLTLSKGTWGGMINPEEIWQRTDDQTYPFSSTVSMGIDIKF
ncbi:TonB-dependent receptor [Aquipluma nitroreducens]|uniref:TonB-dependent receptor n=1 Tax=Aquipluma nitroreducens TaxID=2010828 RepID=A0A5K7S3R4_9BACT|nr:TonB-dependent receptor [Aquipluma nitroreducens]BBE16182.1 TonB-dependent receptor [Aquipluma nitroreducens]